VAGLPKPGSAVAVLAAWDARAYCYLVGGWLALRRSRLLGEARLSTDRLPSARVPVAEDEAAIGVGHGTGGPGPEARSLAWGRDRDHRRLHARQGNTAMR
jgi:hypothetical protein